MIKINILLELKELYGGSHTFLRALKEELISEGLYEETPKKADVLLFDSFQEFKKTVNLKYQYPHKIFIHRIDGPVYLYRGKDKNTDRVVYKLNELIADGTVFQSKWSKKNNTRFGMIKNNFETVILNAPNPNIFNRQNKIKFSLKRKTRLIATSWSTNLRKGFEIYNFLDKNLDFSKYKMTFIGRAPIKFKNIKHLGPLSSTNLAKILKQQDIYITASQNDPCSNALIEALSCDLPAVALNSGGHPELLKKGGELFDSSEDVILKIEKVIKNYKQYQSSIQNFSIEKATKKYYDFCNKVYCANKKSNKTKFINLLCRITLKNFSRIFLKYKFLNKIIIR